MDQSHYDHALEIYKCVLETKETRPPHLGTPSTSSCHLCASTQSSARTRATQEARTAILGHLQHGPFPDLKRALALMPALPLPVQTVAVFRGQCRGRGQEPRGLERMLLARRCGAWPWAAHVAKAAAASVCTGALADTRTAPLLTCA